MKRPQGKSQQISDDIRRELVPLDTETLFELARDMRPYRYCSGGWRGHRNTHLDESIEAQIGIGLHERAAQTEVLHATIPFGRLICLHADRYIDPDSLAPSML